MGADYVVFLQNAWSPFYAGRTWPRRSWLHALIQSQSGRRLRFMLDDFDLCENTTPIVGATADSVVPADFEHIKEILQRRSPRVVVACGKQAEEALLELWDKALLIVPHPAYRLVTNDLFKHARICIERIDSQTRMKLSQSPGSVTSRIIGVVK